MMETPPEAGRKEAHMEDLRRFAEAVWEPADVVEVRMLPGRASLWMRADKLADCGEIKDANNRGENVYAGANPRRASGDRDAGGVALARCVFVDIDNCQNIGRVRRAISEAGLPAPTIILFSGGGYHLYWRLEDAIADMARWTRLQRGIIAKLKGVGLDQVDGKIHDAPRIMRLPGFTNHKRGVPAALIECEPARVYAVAEFPEGEAPSVFECAPQTNVSIEDARLAYKTMQFISGGAPEGERNARLFAAACDMAGCGIAREVADPLLIQGASLCGLDDMETRQTIESAWKKSRTPSKPPELTPETIAATANANAARLGVELGSVDLGESLPRGGGGGSTVEAEEVGGHDVDIPVERVPISNVIDGTYIDKENGRVKSVTYYKPIEAVASHLRTVTGGWPKVVGDTLFVQHKYASGWRVRYLSKTDDLFAWMAEVADVRWSEASCLCKESKAPRTPATKGEFLRHLQATSPDRYLAVSELPHEPPMGGYYYLPLDLPDATGEHLEELVASFNAATEHDRSLMLACLLTMFWGGTPGTRPGFIFDAESPGSGKSATVDIMTRIAGGAHVVADPDQHWSETTRQMMSGPSSGARAIVFDNVRKIVEGQAIESAITSPSLSGWRVYVGLLTRPNDVTVIITANGAQASQDMATRLVRICVGRPIAGRDWVTWASQYVEKNRLAIIADVLAVLRGARRTDGVGMVGDRFSGWQADILARIAGGPDLSRTIFDRRQGIDGDAEKGEEIAQAVYQWATGNGYRSTATLNTYQVWKILVGASLWEEQKYGAPPDRYVLRKCFQHVQRLTARWGLFEVAKTSSGSPSRVKVELDGSEKTAQVQSVVFNMAKFRACGLIGEPLQDDDIPI